jgi:hypothetical protein
MEVDAIVKYWSVVLTGWAAGFARELLEFEEIWRGAAASFF